MKEAGLQSYQLTLNKNIYEECKHELLSTYLLTSGKAIFLVYGEQIAVFKDSSLNEHYEAKHTKKYNNWSDAEWEQTFESLLDLFSWSLD